MTANHDLQMRRMEVIERLVKRIAQQPVVRSVLRGKGRAASAGGGGRIGQGEGGGPVAVL